MEIEFEINLDDCFALNEHLIKTSSEIKARVRKGQTWWSAGPFGGAVLLAIFQGMGMEEALMMFGSVAVGLSVPGYYIYPHYFRWQNRKFLKKNVQAARDNGIIGTHSIKITDTHFEEKTSANENSIPWNEIDRIENAPDHTFIFINDSSAYLVPRHSLSAETYDDFVQKIQEVHQKNAETLEEEDGGEEEDVLAT